MMVVNGAFVSVVIFGRSLIRVSSFDSSSLLLQLRFPEKKLLTSCIESTCLAAKTLEPSEGRRLEISNLIYTVYLKPHAFYLVCFSVCLILSHSKIICLSPLQNKPQVSGQNRRGMFAQLPKFGMEI